MQIWLNDSAVVIILCKIHLRSPRSRLSAQHTHTHRKRFNPQTNERAKVLPCQIEMFV